MVATVAMLDELRHGCHIHAHLPAFNFQSRWPPRPQETAAAEGSVSNAADGSEPVVEQSAQDEFMDEKWLVPFDLNSTLLSWKRPI